MSEKPKLPQVGDYVRMKGRLVEIQDVTPKEIVLDYIFEDTEATVYGMINGKIVREYGTFNNFYGQDSCVKSAVEEAENKQKELGESDLEFVVAKKTTQNRMRPNPRNLSSLYAPEFRDMALLDHGCCAGLPNEKIEKVWSSVHGWLIPDPTL
jgi:hypothetical protein